MKETEQRNREIALFMGWKEATEEYKMKWCGVRTPERLYRINQDYVPYLVKEGVSEPIFKDSLEYHSSWDWLMPVVEKIESNENFIDISKNYVTIMIKGQRTKSYPVVNGNKITTLFLAVSDFCLTQNKK